MVDVGQVINGKYRVVRLIGDGGMGSVWEAHHEVLGVNVALKFLHPELSEEFNLKERFLQEARVSATIQSPHIVRVMDVDVFGDQPYLVMDLLQGEPLQRRIHHLGRLTVAQTLDFAQQMLEGLQQAHDKNVVHRDLKPDNVFITKGQHGEELLKILDFGIAKLKQDAGAKVNLTQPGAVMGTPEYMAPEQAYSADQVDARSDVYSVGVMLFEMLSGKRPAEGETPQEIAHKILMGQVLRLEQVAPDVPAGLMRVIHTAMEPRPEDRWADARALREALLPFMPVNPFAATGVAGRPLTGQGTPFVAVSKTPRIDGGRTANASERPPTRVDAAGKQARETTELPKSSLEVPIVFATEQVPATLPPSAGPPRASALPPDPALAASRGGFTDIGPVNPAPANRIRQTADMQAAPDLRAASPAATVNIPAVPNAQVGRRATVVTRRSGSSWGVYATAVGVLLAVGGAYGYYYYENVYDAPIPPPRPVRHTLAPSVVGETLGAQTGAPRAAEGPTQLAPLDPGALEQDPAAADRWRVPVSPAPSPRPSPGAGGGSPAASTSTPSAGGVPVFTLPTAIPLPSGSIPIVIPTSLPQITFPTGFSIPGLTPPPAANSN